MTLGSSRLIQEEAKPEGAKPPLLPRVTWVPTDLYGVLQILRANWMVVVLCVIVGIVGMLAWMAVIGPSYTVSAKILVRLGPEVATSSLLMARGGTQGGAGIRRPEDTMSVVEILTNPRLIHAAVASFGEGFFVDSPPVTPVQHIKSFFKAGLELVRDAMREAIVLVGLRPPTTKLDRLVLAIGTGLRIEPVRRTDVIEVSLGFPSPRVGEVILGRFLELALADHVQAYRMSGAAEFFAVGVATQHAELRRAEQKLLAARTQTERLARELEGIGTAAIEISRLEQEVARLGRAVEVYEKGLDDARIAEAMETIQLSGLRIVMPPTAEIIPSSPSIRRGLLVGLTAGLALSFVIIGFMDYRRKSKLPEDTVVATVSTVVTLPPESKVNT